MIKSKKLEAWQKALGDKAKTITKKASDRGTALHKFCEKYLLNEEVTGSIFDSNYEIFKRVKPVLDQHVDDVLGIELSLFSKMLMVAGTPDVVASYKKKPAIIDFKTIKSGSKITAERILKYFLQGVFYSIMIKELYEIDIRRVVLIFGTENDEPPTVLDLEIKEIDIERVIGLTQRFKQQIQMLLDEEAGLALQLQSQSENPQT